MAAAIIIIPIRWCAAAIGSCRSTSTFPAARRPPRPCSTASCNCSVRSAAKARSSDEGDGVSDPPRDGEGDHAKHGGGGFAPRSVPPPPRRFASRSPSPYRGGFLVGSPAPLVQPRDGIADAIKDAIGPAFLSARDEVDEVSIDVRRESVADVI